eukprot:6184460-Pleurochrysis_carterae.AAC.6
MVVAELCELRCDNSGAAEFEAAGISAALMMPCATFVAEKRGESEIKLALGLTLLTLPLRLLLGWQVGQGSELTFSEACRQGSVAGPERAFARKAAVSKQIVAVVTLSPPAVTVAAAPAAQVRRRAG